jgi:hypothetical protein
VTAPIQQLQLDFDQEGSAGRFPIRLENRRELVEQVEFAVFPRAARDQRESVGSTVDRSDSGLCIRTGALQVPGTILRVVVRDIDDRSNFDALMRVVWSREVGEDQFQSGLVMITGGQRHMRMVRPTSIAQLIATSA